MRHFLLVSLLFLQCCNGQRKSRTSILLEEDGEVLGHGSIMNLGDLNYDGLLELLGDDSEAG